MDRVHYCACLLRIFRVCELRHFCVTVLRKEICPTFLHTHIYKNTHTQKHDTFFIFHIILTLLRSIPFAEYFISS